LKFEEFTEKIGILRYLLQDQEGTDMQEVALQDLTVETRVLVEGVSWCLIKGCTTEVDASGNNDMSDGKWFWMPESTFVQKFNIVVEDYDFPRLVGKDEKTSKNNLVSTVYKYLTSEMEIDDFISAAKQVIEFSPKEKAIISRKFDRCKPTS